MDGRYLSRSEPGNPLQALVEPEGPPGLPGHPPAAFDLLLAEHRLLLQAIDGEPIQVLAGVDVVLLWRRWPHQLGMMIPEDEWIMSEAWSHAFSVSFR